MSTLKFEIKYETPIELIISPEEIVKQYLYGLPICGVQGRELTNGIIANKIKTAMSIIEAELFIKLTEQMVHESSDFRREHWRNFGYVKTSYPVNKPLALDGYYNNIKQIGYPMQWINSRREDSSLSGSDEAIFYRQIYIIPSGTTGNATSGGVTYNGATPFLLFQGLQYIPNYWRCTYVTGFRKVPREIMDVVGKLAAIQLLSFLGDIYMGVGMSSYSIGIDGLSQSTSLNKSWEYGIYGARMKLFNSDIFGTDGKGGMMKDLKSKYKGIIFDVC